MRFVVLLVSVAGCTADNPDYDPYWMQRQMVPPLESDLAQPRDLAVNPDLAVVPSSDAAMPRDLSTADVASAPADLAIPQDLTPPADLVQPSDFYIFAWCEGQPTLCNGKPLDPKCGDGWTCCPFSNYMIPCRAIGESCGAQRDCWPGDPKQFMVARDCQAGRCCLLATVACEKDADCCSGKCPGAQQFNGHCQ